MMRSTLITVVATGILSCATRVLAAPTLQVFPDSVNLETSRDYQSVVVQLVQDDGITRDVTADAQLTLADANLAKIENKNVLYPAADGATTLSIKYGDLPPVSVPVTVKEAKADRPISFKLDVMPVFMRAGCNSGSCHGAARGKDGFRLSLFGYDADGDYQRLTRAGEILRRHRPRRHAPGLVPQQQRQLRQDQPRRRRHRRQARRGVHHGSLCHVHRRQPGHRYPQGPEVHLAQSAGEQLRRRAGQQQAQEAADHAVGAV